MIWEKDQFETIDLGQIANKIRFKSLYFAFTSVVFCSINTPYIMNSQPPDISLTAVF